MEKHRLPGLILKVDFSKAFDTVEWSFLFNLLKARGFSERWVGWIRAILCSSKARFLINGTQCGYVQYRRGLRQGDPLSPLLFALVMDVMGTIFNNALRSGILHGVALDHSGVKMCHLEYANNLLVMTTGGGEDLRIIKLILFLFEGLSGLTVNLAKSRLYSSPRNTVPLLHLTETVHCGKGSLPLTYLGIPISVGRPRKQDWDILINKLQISVVEIEAAFLRPKAHFVKLCSYCYSYLLEVDL